MEARGRRLSWWMGGVAAVGVLVTHWLAYRLALPDAEHRADVLHHTGHVHLPVVSAVGPALFTMALLRLCTHVRRGERLPSFAAMAARLAVLQAVAWTVLEVGERAVSGRLTTVDDHALLVIGLGVQVAVAVVGAVVVRLGLRVLSVLVPRRRAVRPRPRSMPLPTSCHRPHRMVPLKGAHALRGPPRLRPAS